MHKIRAAYLFVFGQSLFTNISNLTITGGSGYYGGGIDNNGRLTVTNCTISGNVATGSGGGIESPHLATGHQFDD